MMNRLDDRDILTDCLEDTKWGSSSYHMAILESANEPVRSTLLRMHNDELMLHKSIFEMMRQRGFYQVEPATRTSQQAQTAYQPEQSYQTYETGYSPQVMHQSMYQANQNNPNVSPGTYQQR